jgi:hypothetical protein
MTPRSIRVFISSTFADMQAERDELVLRVFPQLRNVCEERGVAWGEIDLRWGVTAEEIDEGDLLPICFARIDESRPFFIALLGERYGARIKIPQSLLDREPWLLPYDGRSATELEIVYAMQQPEERRMLFYVRDPSEYRASAEDQASLRDLLECLRAKAVPMRSYGDPAVIGELVRHDLSAVIDELVPPTTRPDAAADEEARQQSFVAHMTTTYAPIAGMFKRLDQHVADQKGALVITGGSGVGKSALLANWLTSSRDTPWPPSRLARIGRALGLAEPIPSATFVLSHFMEASPRASDWSTVLIRLGVALRERFQLRFEIPDDADALRVAFPSWLQNLPPEVRVILVIDGLDHQRRRDDEIELGWLPESFPPNVNVIVSTAQGSADAELRRRGYAVIDVPRPRAVERRELIRGVLREWRKNLAQPAIEKITIATEIHPPVFLRLLLEELRVFGDFAKLDTAITDYLAAATTEELYERILARFERQYSARPRLVEDTLTLFSVSALGLTNGELHDLLGEATGTPLPEALWSPLYFALKPFLIDRAGLLAIARPDLRSAIEARYLQNNGAALAARHRMALYFRDRRNTARSAVEYAAQLEALSDWSALQELLTSSALTLLWSADREQVIAHWAEMETHSPFRMRDAYSDPSALPIEAANVACDLLIRFGEYPTAMAIAAALELKATTAGDSIRQRDALNRSAIVLRKLGRFSEALQRLESEERICREGGDQARLAASLGNEAAMLRELDRPAEAARKLAEEERICRSIGDYRGLMINLGNQAALRFDEAEMETALALLNEQETLARRLGDPLTLARNLDQSGVVLGKGNQLAAAAPRHAEAEAIFRRLSDFSGLQACLGHTALIERRRSHYDRANDLLDEQEAICRRLNDAEGLAHSLAQRASFYAFDLGAAAPARPIADEALAIASTHRFLKLQRELEQLVTILKSRAN